MKLFNEYNKRLYIVCFIPRSGSTFLCSLLNRNGYGAPQEYYYPYEFNDRLKNWHGKLGPQFPLSTTKDDYLDKIMEFQSPIAGIKSTWDAYKIMESETSGKLDRINPKYLYLKRSNKLKQAISWAKSLQTGIWVSEDHKPPHEEPKYDKELIDKCLGYIECQEEMFDKSLADKDRLDLNYEDLCDDQDMVMQLMSNFLNVKTYPKVVGIILHRQEKMDNSINERWYRRYKNDTT